MSTPKTSQDKPKKKETAVSRLIKAYLSSQAQLEKLRNGLISTARNRQRAFANGLHGQAEALDARFVSLLVEEKRLRDKRVRDWRSYRLVSDPPGKKPRPKLESERVFRSIQRSCRRTRVWLLMLIRARWAKQPDRAPDRPWEKHELVPSLGTKTHFASGLVRPKPLTDEELEAWQKRFSQPSGGAMVRRQQEAVMRLGGIPDALKDLEPKIAGYLRGLETLEAQRQIALQEWLREKNYEKAREKDPEAKLRTPEEKEALSKKRRTKAKDVLASPTK